MSIPNTTQELSKNNDSAPQSTPQVKVFKVSQPHYQAVILHPSLGSPLIVENAQTISLFIVTNWNFAKVFADGSDLGDEPGATGGNNIKLVINQSLKVLPWKIANAALKDPSRAEGKLYPSRPNGHANITCTCLGKLKQELHDRKGRHFANLHSSILEQLEDAKLKYLYQIDLNNLANITAGGMYDCFWSVGNPKPDKAADLSDNFLDVQDRLTRQYVFKNYYKYKNEGAGAPQEAPTYAFKVESEGIIFEEDPETPIMTRHPIYVPPAGKTKLTLGHLSDVHVSSKQHAYKGRRATVIPGVDETVSPPIGDKANNNVDNFFDLLQQFGKAENDVDLLVITGDLYDHLHNFDPRSRKIETTGNLWEAMYLDSIKAVQERADEYPCGIDGLIVYSLLIHYYTTHEKPIFITSGNHEAYEYPYGISPRITGIGKVNDGIPLDHNLTIYEAILLYGPGYEKVLKKLNFSSHNSDWFFSLFTPLADSAFNYREQCLIGLEWGEGESFILSKVRGGGTLPRATGSLNKSQRNLVSSALSQNKETVLFSHFTMVNYSLKQSLAEEGQVNVNTAVLGNYDHGSSQGARSSLYGEIINHPNLKLSLSGHSHRVGLYDCDQVKEVHHSPDAGKMGMGYMPMQPQEYVAHVKTRGIHPEDPNAKHIGSGQKTRLLVSASAGPIPKQNLKGEMSGQGMEYPSGSKVASDGNITLIKREGGQAKPRFAVACDYIDIMEGGFWEHFKAVGNDGEFELKICWDKIRPEFPDDKKNDFIESVTLWLVGSDESIDISMSSKKIIDDTHKIIFSSDLQTQIEFFGEAIDAIFASFKFSEKSISDLSGFKEYDYASPWNIQIGIYDTLGREVELSEQEDQVFFSKALKKIDISKGSTNPSKWQIMRHKRFGEVPYFRWRSQQCPAEYKYLLKKKKT